MNDCSVSLVAADRRRKWGQVWVDVKVRWPLTSGGKQRGWRPSHHGCTLPLTHTHLHTHSHRHKHTQTNTHTLTHLHTLSQTHTHTHSHSHTLNFHLRLYSRSLAQFSCFSQSESVCAFTRLHHCVFEPEQVCLRFHQRCINVENQQRWSDKMARGVMTHSHQALWDTHTWQSDTHLCWRIHYSHHETAFYFCSVMDFQDADSRGFFWNSSLLIIWSDSQKFRH